jgi:hypothetical protein
MMADKAVRSPNSDKSISYRQLFIKTVICTVSALIAFAANSVLCRLALGEDAIDASSFTFIRLLSGALVLFIILQIKGDKNRSSVKI